MTAEELKALYDAGEISQPEYQLRLIGVISGVPVDSNGPPTPKAFEKALENWAGSL